MTTTPFKPRFSAWLVSSIAADGSAKGVDEVFVPHLLGRKNLQHGDLAVRLEEGSESWNTIEISGYNQPGELVCC